MISGYNSSPILNSPLPPPTPPHATRIDIGAIHTGKKDPILERLVGLDVVVCDKDEEGSFSWMSWGHGTNKVASSDRIGFALLGGKDTGTIKGTIQWEDREEGMKPGMKLGKVHIQSLLFDELWVHLQPNQEGIYEAELPVGKYRINAGSHGMSETREVEVKKGREVTVGELVGELVFKKPAMAIGTIDYYGLRAVSEKAVSQKLGIPLGDTLAESSAAIVERLEEVPGVVQARVQTICCAEGKTMLYVGVAEEGAPQIEYRTPPDWAIALPQEITETYRQRGEALNEWVRKIRKGGPYDDESQGHTLSGSPEVRAFDERFIGFAEEHLERLRQVLRHASDAEQRHIATWVIAYAADKRTVVDDLLYAVQDTDPVVRNNATRALGTIARFAQNKPELGIRISPTPFIAMLNSIEWTDRNKALSVLSALTRNRDAAVIEQLRKEALPSLVEMARWKSMGHAAWAYILLCRVDGLTDEEIAETLRNGEKEAVIARIAESIQTER